MKLVQKKCPGCGASLSFNENATKTKCEYCKQEIFIEKETKDHLNGFAEDVYQLSLEEFRQASKIHKISFYGVMIFIAAIFIMAIFSFVFFFKDFNSLFNGQAKDFPMAESSVGNTNTSTENTPLKKDYITEISQINESSLSKLKIDSLNVLNHWTTTLQNPDSTKWEYVGMYLLVSKTDYNELYMVYRRKYTVNNKKVETYGAVSYTNLKLNGETISESLSGFPLAPMKTSDDLKTIYFGYKSNEILFNEEIKPKINKYEVKATTGLFR